MCKGNLATLSVGTSSVGIASEHTRNVATQDPRTAETESCLNTLPSDSCVCQSLRSMNRHKKALFVQTALSTIGNNSVEAWLRGESLVTSLSPGAEEST